MAAVIALPSAATEPVPRARWRGRYPKGVTPISWQRRKRREEQLSKDEREAKGREDTVLVLRVLLGMARAGEVAGLLLVHEHANGTQETLLTGSLSELDRAIDAATHSADNLTALQYDA